MSEVHASLPRERTREQGKPKGSIQTSETQHRRDISIHQKKVITKSIQGTQRERELLTQQRRATLTEPIQTIPTNKHKMEIQKERPTLTTEQIQDTIAYKKQQEIQIGRKITETRNISTAKARNRSLPETANKIETETRNKRNKLKTNKNTTKKSTKKNETYTGNKGASCAKIFDTVNTTFKNTTDNDSTRRHIPEATTCQMKEATTRQPPNNDVIRQMIEKIAPNISELTKQHLYEVRDRLISLQLRDLMWVEREPSTLQLKKQELNLKIQYETTLQIQDELVRLLPNTTTCQMQIMINMIQEELQQDIHKSTGMPHKEILLLASTKRLILEPTMVESILVAHSKQVILDNIYN